MMMTPNSTGFVLTRPRRERSHSQILGDVADVMTAPIFCQHPVHLGEGWVYILHAPEVARVKIGTCGSNGLRARVAGLSSLSPVLLSLVAVAFGGTHLEKHWHRRFRKHWHHGEWFDASEIVPLFVDAMLKAPRNGCARCVIEGDRWQRE